MKMIFTTTILLLIFSACGKKTYSVEDVLSWHARHFNDPVLDSLGYEQVATRNDYVMIDVNYENDKLRFIVNKNSTVEDFNYSKCMILKSDYFKEIKRPINSTEFKISENRAKKIFSYYLNFEKVEFTNYENPNTIFGSKKIYFNFGEKFTLVYSPNRAEKLINYFSKTSSKSEIIKIDSSWFLF